MFTGLIEASATVLAVEPRGTGLRVWLAASDPAWALRPGQSVAVSGACLSVAAAADPDSGEAVEPGRPGASLAFDLSPETLERTWFRSLAPGSRVNLERALKLGDRLDGHLVSGHVDGLARICAVQPTGDGGCELEFEVDAGLERYLIEKGSIALDGISLTIVRPAGRRFHVALIPLTLEKTSLGTARAGDRVNVEADQLGKWIERLLAARS